MNDAAPGPQHNIRAIYDRVKEALARFAELDSQAQEINAEKEKIKSGLEEVGITRKAFARGREFRGMTEDQRRAFKEGAEIMLAAIAELERDETDGGQEQLEGV